MDKIKNFYIFTGKGGVGKTTLSFSFAKYLQSQNRKVKYVYFESSSISDKKSTPVDQGQELGRQLGVETIGLDLSECAKTYVSKKLKSATIGKWVVKTPFFKALVNMIPGFNYLIYLGRILEYLNEDPELTLILDSPSSGHALTMLEATHNFSEIFQSGVVFDDTKKMIDLMFSENFLQVNILTIPTMMAVHESQDLNKSLQKITQIHTKIICNNTFHDIDRIEDSVLPEFLQNKILNEQEVVKEHSDTIAAYVSHSPSISKEQISKDLVPLIESLV